MGIQTKTITKSIHSCYLTMKPFTILVLLALVTFSFAAKVQQKSLASASSAEESVADSLKGLSANIGLAESMVKGIQSSSRAAGISGATALAAGHKICITYESPGGHSVEICWESD